MDAQVFSLRFRLRGRQIASVDFLGKPDALMAAVAEGFVLWVA